MKIRILDCVGTPLCSVDVAASSDGDAPQDTSHSSSSSGCVSVTDPVGVLIPLVHKARQAVQAEGEDSASDIESDSDDEYSHSLDALMREGMRECVSLHIQHRPVSPSLPLGLCLAHATLGVLEMTAVFTLVSIDTESGADTHPGLDVGLVGCASLTDYTPTGRIVCPSPVSECLAVLGPSFDADPAAVLVSGRVVNLLNRTRSVLVNVLDSVVVQTMCVDATQVPDDCVLCTQDNRFHLFSLPEDSFTPTLLRLQHSEGRLCWQPVELTVSPNAAAALQDTDICTLSTQPDGSVHVSLTHYDWSHSTLRVDTSSRTLSVIRTRAATPAATLSSDGYTRTPCEIGSIVQIGEALHVSVLHSTSVYICGTVLDYALHDNCIVYSSRGRMGVYLHRVQLAQFRDTPQLPVATEPQPAAEVYDWAQSATAPWDNPPTLRCSTGTGCFAVWLRQDMEVLCVSRYSPHEGWVTLAGERETAGSIPSVATPSSALYHRGSVFGNVQGQ
eukprot:g3284.t1